MKIKIKKQTLPKIMTKTGSDDFQTPAKAIVPLLYYLKKEWIIWECSCGKGNLVRKLNKKGFKVIGTDINMTLDGRFSFFKYSPKIFDCIITNPPFSKKNEFIERCYKLNKPFALLLPLGALETKRRQRQWKKGLQLIVLNHRVIFEGIENNKLFSCWFGCAWFTYGLNLPKDIIFAEIKPIGALIE